MGLDGRSYLTPVYTRDAVARLLGLEEDWASQGRRDVTVLDLLSWARDPGGMSLRDDTEVDAWMARRGPLLPDSEPATILYDFMRATSRLSLLEHAVVALTVCGFSESEMASVLRDGRAPISQQRVGRILHGRPKRDSAGSKVTDEQGFTIYTGGVVGKLTREMNGTRRREHACAWEQCPHPRGA
jgi:hypothetical protein